VSLKKTWWLTQPLLLLHHIDFSPFQPEQAYIFKDPKLQSAIQGDCLDEDSKDVHLFFRALAVCHSVVIDRDSKESREAPPRGEADSSDGSPSLESLEEDTNAGSKIVNLGDQYSGESTPCYQAASPDEAALVVAAQKLGFGLCVRSLHLTHQDDSS
jgi:magnesium-transporting ATPase (P-type)